MPPHRLVGGDGVAQQGDGEILAALAAGRINTVTAIEALAAGAAWSPPPEATPVPTPAGRGPGGGRPATIAIATPPSPPPPEVALAALEGLIGLEAVKQAAREIYALSAVGRLRREALLPAAPTALHMVFRGPPGTGKTTVARAFGEAFRAMGALERGQLVEVERADLVGEYVGHTAQRTREAVTRALGGVLFVDEAYALARGGEKDFGREAIDTLVRQMEEHRSRLVVVLAGYPAEMDAFLATNPGLASRIPIHLDFRDYDVGELTAIGRAMLRERGYRLSAEADARLGHAIVRRLAADGERHGNARSVRNLVELALRRHAVRILAAPELAAGNRTLLSTVEVEDLLPTPRPGAHAPPLGCEG